ncbi:phage terminase large subunit [uncultured Sneathiella sp.]|jgi:predicted phage terminase large subunit-like protein|uniref:phage terminase large subunit n=1 Tax=uncultured Sneathiella sp. TaxID=879315 RepID=UPI0030DD3DB4|tara:strand:+ start:76786 stop:78276 length:1491 start_codon:yes stop_codon:yes gene_type:complete
MKTDIQAVYAIYRTIFKDFCLKLFELFEGEQCMGNWHIDCMAYLLEGCVTRDIKRLMIAIGPRYLKSFCASIALPIWILGNNPKAKIICVSYSDGLAADFSAKRRKLLEDPFIKKLFPKLKISKMKNTEKSIFTTEGGGIYTTSVGGTLTGFGCDYLIIDDPIKPNEAMSEAERKKVNDWYHHTAFTRLNNKNTGCVIIISQRVHCDDLIGHLLELEEDEWCYLDIPAIEIETISYQVGDDAWYERKAGEPLHAERESLAILEGIKKSVGSYIFETQYQQNPAPPGGALFKKKWLRRYPNAVSSEKFDSIVDSWDTAAGTGPNNAYSCCTTWGIRGGRYFLLDCRRFKLEYPELLKTIVELAKARNANAVLVEHASSGIQVYQNLQHTNLKVIPIKPTGDKESRATMTTNTVEAGKVFLPEKADWLQAFEHEILSFPGSKYADQVDSMTQFLLWARESPIPDLNVKVSQISMGGHEIIYQDNYFARTGIGVFDNLF